MSAAVDNEKDILDADDESSEKKTEVELSVDEITTEESTSNTVLPLGVQPRLISDDITMKPYQLQALHWMIQRERGAVYNSCSMSSSSLSSVRVNNRLPHEGLIQIPSQIPSSNPLWQPILGISMSFTASYLPQEIQVAVGDATHAALHVFFWNRYSHKLQLRIRLHQFPAVEVFLLMVRISTSSFNDSCLNI